MRTFATGLAWTLSIATTVAACTNPVTAISNRAMDVNAYNAYLKNAGELNMEREKAGLSPAPILTRDEWAGKKKQ